MIGARVRWWGLIVGLAGLTACAGLGVETSSQAAFDAGLALFNQGQHEKAIPHFVKATELDPEFARAYLYLGRSHINLRQWLDALSPLRTAWRLAPGDTQKEMAPILIDALIGAAGTLLSKGNFQESIALFKEALELAPQSAEAKQSLFGALVQYGGQLLAEGKASEAIGAYTEATQLAPQESQGYLGVARSFFQSGNIFKAFSAANQALQLSPNDGDVMSLMRQLQGR